MKMARPKKKQKKKPKKKTPGEKQNDLLRNILIITGAIILIVIAIYFFAVSQSKFIHRGVDFEIVKEGELILYQTSIPVTYQGQVADYNFYLRNDPRKLEEVPFEGELVFLRNIIINSTENFLCEGHGNVAVANLVNLYQVSGANVMKDPNATCDSGGEYLFIQLQRGNETGVKQINDTCYEININECEILEGTEKLMVEIFVRLNEVLEEPSVTVSPVE